MPCCDGNALISIGTTTACAGALIASGYHFLTAKSSLKGPLPFHFDIHGRPSMFTSPRWFFLYPCLVGFTAWQVVVMRKSREGTATRAPVDPKVAASAAVVATVGTGVLVYAQVVAAKVSAGTAEGMSEVRLTLAALAGACVPTLVFQYQWYSREKRKAERRAAAAAAA